MKRGEYRTFFELGDYGISDELAAYELLRSVNHSMADRLYILKA